MVNWDNVKCYECHKCNIKGKLSVMKGSIRCERNRGILPRKEKKKTNASSLLLHFLSQRAKQKKAKK